MGETDRIVFAVIIGTLVVLTLIGLMGFLLVVNTNRRNRHRADLAEADLRRKQEVVHAVREATQQTLREVGREMHDNLGQLLTVTWIGMNNAIDDGTTAPLPAARDALDQGIEEVRRLGRSLNTDLWNKRTLLESMAAEAERIERVARVRTTLVVNGDVPDLPRDSAIILYRVFQEIMNNALKHSRADTITITVNAATGFAISITDNGRGFDPDTVKANSGLVNIRARCALIGFDARCFCTPGQGCTWELAQQNPHGA